MADDAMFPGPSSKGGIPTWLLIGGAGVGIVALILVISRSSSGGGTTAAGASINAALGSLQSENQNLLGTIQSGQLQNNANFASLGGQLTDTQTSILSAIGSQGTQTGQQIQNAIDSVNQNTNSQTAGVLSGLADALSKILGGQSQITGAIQSETSMVQQGFADTNSNIATSQQQVISSIQSAQNAETALLNQIQPQIDHLIGLQQQLNTQSGTQAAATQAQITDLSNSINSQIQSGNASIMAGVSSIGSFLGWQFYQIPNRYQPFILPGVTPIGWQ